MSGPISWLKRLEGAKLSVAGLVVAAILFLAVNVFANSALRGFQLDLTENRLFTLSQGTRAVLAGLDEPISLRLYFSSNLGEAAPRYQTYYGRVRDLLQHFAEISDGKLQLQLLNPEPFSDAEDRAVGDGLQGVPVTQAGDLGYFGLAGTNSTDGVAAIPFFNLDREPFLEYDLVKLIYGLARPDRPPLGVLIATVPGLGAQGAMNQPPNWMIVDQLREFFQVETLDGDLTAVPDHIRTLLVADLGGLNEGWLRAIDGFVQRGGRLLMFVDPLVESAGGGFGAPPAQSADVNRLLSAWGLEMVDGKVAGDIDAARRVSSGAAQGNVVGNYVVWLSLLPTALDTGDPVMANIERLNLATAGILQPLENTGLQIKPLMFTGPRSMQIATERVRFMPDILGLLRDFKPENRSLVLAARISGEAKSAFAEPTAGEGSDGSAGEASVARKPINVIVVADIDMLYDRFWVETGNFFGQRVVVPQANNADFVINAAENLNEGDALIGLRGRGTSHRPFTLVEEIRTNAELRYRATEQALRDKLKGLEAQLKGLRGQDVDAGEVVLTAEDKAAIERFRGEMLTVRKDLRDVQRALRLDIERLESQVKFLNIAAVPILLGLIALVVVVVRRLHRRRSPAMTR